MTNNFLNLRLQKNSTQVEIAKLLNMSQGSYRKYETGETEPSIEKLIKLADYYNVSIDYLVGRDYASPIGYLNEFDTIAVQNYLMLNDKNKMQASSYIAGLLFAQ